MRRHLVEIALAAVASLGACAGSGARTQDPGKQESQRMSGAISPSGDKHPGEIRYEDKVERRTWSNKAADVPQTMAWVEVSGTWKAVARIEITGAADRRCITKFGAGGEMLETTIVHLGAPPRGEGAAPVPTPTPTPTPGEE